MASHGEREPGVDIDVMLDEPMVQDTREEDTSLPQGWEKWLCHAPGYFYYYNCATERG